MCIKQKGNWSYPKTQRERETLDFSPWCVSLDQYESCRKTVRPSCASVSPHVRWGRAVFGRSGEERQLYFPESSVHLEQEQGLYPGDVITVCLETMLSASSFLKIFRSTRGPPWIGIILTSKVFSLARWLLHSLEGGGIGRHYLWQMELTFCHLDSYLFYNPVRITGLLFLRPTEVWHSVFSHRKLLGPPHPHHWEPTCTFDTRSTCIASICGLADVGLWQKSSPLSKWSCLSSSNPEDRLVLWGLQASWHISPDGQPGGDEDLLCPHSLRLLSSYWDVCACEHWAHGWPLPADIFQNTLTFSLGWVALAMFPQHQGWLQSGKMRKLKPRKREEVIFPKKHS